MKARVLTIGEFELKRLIKKEVAEQKTEMYKQAVKDVLPQVLAISLSVLESEDWRSVRLNRFLDKFKDYMSKPDKETTTDLVNHLKDRYNIDLDVILADVYPVIRIGEDTRNQ